jgi:hypothetical protein
MVNKQFGVYFFYFILSHAAFAQLVELGAPRNQSTTASNVRTQSATAISLPFWDDFSWATTDKPDSLWVNSQSVSVNRGNGRRAPSINVATFDGLNENGVPYTTNPAEYQSFGFTDELTSRPIKMTEVTIPDRNSVFFSFFYQWSGYGETPDARDFLMLEFLDDQSQWIEIMTMRATSNIKPDTFYHVMIRINQNQYFHDNFQFRFRSSGRRSGYYDTWNIDYVYLDKGRSEAVTDYADKTINSSLDPLFKDGFHAVPLNHFFNNPATNISFSGMMVAHLVNIQPNPWNYTITADIHAIRKDETNVSNNEFIIFDDTRSTLEKLEKRSVTFSGTPDLTAYSSYDSLITISLNVNIDNGEIDFDEYTGRYQSQANNAISQTFTLSNYYAYDDGTAESSAGLTTNGQKAVIRFPMLTSQRDTINAVSIYFAHHGQAAPISVELQVYDDVGGKPGPLLYSELIPAQQQPLNTFLTHKLLQGVPVKDTFYIGWEEITALKVARIGLDKNNDTGHQLFYNANGTWELNDRVQGSLMFRPLFGKGNVITGFPNEPVQPLSFYPNPNSGTFVISGVPEQLQIHSSTGIPVTFASEQIEELKTKISLMQPAAGLYIVRYRKGATLFTQKIMVR